MDKEIKREAFKQYLHYFRIWFIVIGIMAVFCAGAFVMHSMAGKGGRVNHEAPAERVFDDADVLTDEEEQKLRDYIAQKEKKYQIDIVLLTVREDVESQGSWESVMRNRADDFYDENNYGYNRIHGDGVLLLDNWYEDTYGSQKGSWLSTCGIVEDRFGDSEVNKVLTAVYNKVDASPYNAYMAYVDSVCRYVEKGSGRPHIPAGIIVILSLLVAVIYAVIHLKQSPAKETVTASTYVAGGRPVVKDQRDNFIRKNVVTRRIETSSSGGSSGRSGGGHHTSSGGVSHGGGGMRR